MLVLVYMILVLVLERWEHLSMQHPYKIKKQIWSEVEFSFEMQISKEKMIHRNSPLKTYSTQMSHVLILRFDSPGSSLL